MYICAKAGVELTAVHNKQEHVDAHFASSAYPDVLANIGGCFLMGVMYESRVRTTFFLSTNMALY